MSGLRGNDVQRTLTVFATLLGLSLSVGCSRTDARFKLNEVQILLAKESTGYEIGSATRQDLADSLGALFGTPDEPYIPAGLPEEIAGLLDPRELEQAAGPVKTNEDGLTVSGLYRQHCAHCHGLSGDGAGPTAPFLNPYPRDYRLGQFKFKSTPIGSKPTDDDLRRVLVDGIPGTAMPSFKLLPPDEINSLIEYVKYLSIRGEVERNLYDDAALDEFSTDGEYLTAKLTDMMQQWVATEEKVQPAPPPSDEFDWEHAAARGEALYRGTQANCFTCHGPTQLGDGQRNNFDNWTSWALADGENLRPEHAEYGEDGRLKRAGIADFLDVGALPPRPIFPRNLRQGVFRFGRRPVDIYRRILHGIEGTPMPGSDALASDDIWYLVHYVRSLQYETLSEPQHFNVENLRERM